MKFPNPIAIQSIAKRFHCEIIGDTDLFATGINEIHKVESGDITFVDFEKYFKAALHSNASIIILNKRTECPDGKALLLCERPFEVYDQLIKDHRPFRPLSAMISDSAVIHPSTIIEPNVVIAPHVRIGKNCYIQANVTIREYTVIGNHVNIQSGTVIGTDAFYFKKNEATYKKWRSAGRVIIEDHVEIGASCTINKGVSGDTIIGAGTKLDCLIHIGHGVVLGKNCLLAGQVGIGGKTIVGNNVKLLGQVGVANNLVIGDEVTVYAKGGVSRNLEAGKTYFGAPAQEIKKSFRQIAALKQLPDLLQQYRKDK